MGDMPWEAHICILYESKVDFRDVNAACFRAGLRSNEFCIRAASAPATVNEAQERLRRKIANFDRCPATGQIKILSAYEGCLPRKQFDIKRITESMVRKTQRRLVKRL
jgi:DcmR-like sensory protein